MASLLEIVPIENLENRVNSILRSFKDMPGIYICLNKTQRSVENVLKQDGIDTNKLFFIDCVNSEKTRDDVLHIHPARLDKLNQGIISFIDEVKGKKFLLIDALSILLIYNDEDKVASFVKNIINYASKNDVEVITLTPETKGEELLKNISGFFDKIKNGSFT